MSKFFTMLTQIGEAKFANATALANTVKLEKLAIGDGGGTLPTPSQTQTALVNEVRRDMLNTIKVDQENANWIICEQVIPENVGGWTIREVGLYDADGDLVAVGNFPETYKPALQEGSGRIQTIQVVLQVSASSSVELKIDPSIVLATREYVDERDAAHVAESDPHSQYLRSDTDEIFSGALISNARNKGLFGSHNAQKTDQIWSMGMGYQSAADGSDFGNLFGLAYKYTNNPTGGTMAGGHQAVWCVNGIPQSAMGDGLWTNSWVTAQEGVQAPAIRVSNDSDTYLSESGVFDDGKRVYSPNNPPTGFQKVTERFSRSTTGEWTLTGLTPNVPVVLTAQSVTSSGVTFRFRLASGWVNNTISEDAVYTLRCSATNASPTSASSVLIPSETTAVIYVYALSGPDITGKIWG